MWASWDLRCLHRQPCYIPSRPAFILRSCSGLPPQGGKDLLDLKYRKFQLLRRERLLFFTGCADFQV